MSRKLALIIGNSQYEDHDLAQLATPDVDVDALADVLRDPEIGAFDEVVAVVNQSATTVRRAVASFFADKGRDDLLLLYFSGHGIRDDRGKLFLAVKDSEHKLLRGTAIPAAYITDEMDNSRSRCQVLILDCCHSGAFARGMKGAPGASVGTATAFEGTGSGRVVLTATDATQYAWEGDQVVGQAENSVFTHHLIQGLRTGEPDTNADGQITLDELYDYVYEQVVHETPRQKPGKWSYGQHGEIVIARNPHPVVKPAELPHDLQQSLIDPRPWVREGAVSELDRLLRGGHPGMALAAGEALKRMQEDDSRRVANAAAGALEAFEGMQHPAEKAKVEGKKQVTAKRQAVRQIEVERLAREKAEVERKAKAEQERQRLEQERLDREKAEAERKARETARSPALEFRRQIRALPRWALWIGLLLVGGVIVGLLATMQANPPGTAIRTDTNPAAVAFSPTKTISREAPPAQPTHTSPSIILPTVTSPPTVATDEPTHTSPAIILPTDTPPPPVVSAEPTHTPTQVAESGGRIAYTTYMATATSGRGNSEIYSINADGSEMSRLTNSPAYDSSPTWSPDGKHIAFVSDRAGTEDIYVMNADGSEETKLSSPATDDWYPVWSPDGKRIAYLSNRNVWKDPNTLFVMNADGSDQTQLTDSYTGDFAWSPDGRYIAFFSSRDGKGEISLMTADGSELTQLMTTSAYIRGLTWSPDGRRIAFLINVSNSSSEIYVMNADGSGQTRLTNNAAWQYYLSWSPDGTRLAFKSYHDGNDEIYVMNADGSGQTRLTNNPAQDVSPAWSPDGTRIAFVSYRDGNGEIYVMNADGSEQTRLTNNSVNDSSPAWQP